MSDLQGQRDWMIGQLEGMADNAIPRVKALKRKRAPLTHDEQVRRFHAGVEMRRLEQGEVTEEQFAEYVQHWRDELGV